MHFYCSFCIFILGIFLLLLTLFSFGHYFCFENQMSLNHVVEKQECRVVGMDREGHLQYTMNENSLVKMMKEATFPNLIHLFNSCRAEKLSEETTDEFVYNVLILSEEEKESHKYGKAVIKPSRDKWTVSLEAKLKE